MKFIDTNSLQTRKAGSFTFSAVRPEKLGAAEYTLVTLVVDKTGSVAGFETELLKMKRVVVEACQKNARAEFLLLRSVEFNHSVDEVHGFVELAKIDPAQYREPHCTGSTALYDASYSAIAATNEFARALSEKDFGVNGVVILVTDGGENDSSQSLNDVKREMGRGVSSEWLESLNVILVGVNAAAARRELEAFARDAALTQYVDAGQATPQKLARLAEFVSRSISSQSQALGTGGASQPLRF